MKATPPVRLCLLEVSSADQCTVLLLILWASCRGLLIDETRDRDPSPCFPYFIWKDPVRFQTSAEKYGSWLLRGWYGDDMRLWYTHDKPLRKGDLCPSPLVPPETLHTTIAMLKFIHVSKTVSKSIVFNRWRYMSYYISSTVLPLQNPIHPVHKLKLYFWLTGLYWILS